MASPGDGTSPSDGEETAKEDSDVTSDAEAWTYDYAYEYVEVEEEPNKKTSKEQAAAAPTGVKSPKRVRPAKAANSSADTRSTDAYSSAVAKTTKVVKHSKEEETKLAKNKLKNKRVKSSGALSKASGGKSDSRKKSLKSKTSALKKSPNAKPSASIKSRPTVKSNKDWSAQKSSKAISSKVSRVKSSGKSNRSKGMSMQTKSKGTSKPTVKSKSARQSTEKSNKSSHDAAVEMIKQIISEMQAKSSSGKLRSSTTSRASSSGSVTASSSSGGRSDSSAKSRASPSGKSKVNGKNAIKSSKLKTKGKSSFSCTAASSKKIKVKEVKTAPAKRPEAVDNTGSAAKVEPEELTKVQQLTQQMKMDPTMAKALEKYWPELVSAFKKQQGGKEDDKVAPSGVFTNDEMEDLNDELTDLNTSINTLRHSYGSIIRSLVNMQRRREKKKVTLAPVPNAPTDGTATQAPDGSLSGSQVITVDNICGRVSVDYTAKYNMDRFLDGNSRDGVFQELFREVNEINAAMVSFKKFFNAEGYFQAKDYQGQTEFTLSRSQYDDCLKVIKGLSKVVTTILKAYNTDLLDMFRIKST